MTAAKKVCSSGSELRMQKKAFEEKKVRGRNSRGMNVSVIPRKSLLQGKLWKAPILKEREQWGRPPKTFPGRGEREAKNPQGSSFRVKEYAVVQKNGHEG